MKRVIYLLLIQSLIFAGCGSDAIASAKAQSISFLLSQVRTSTTSLVGGKIYAYYTGTLTPKTIWLDRNKAAIAANPYTLDANATAQVFGDGIYHIVIKDAAGVTKFDRDGLPFQDLSGASIANVLDYGSGTLAEAITAIGSAPTTLAYGTNQTLSSNTAIPATLELLPLNGAVISHSAYTISYSGDTSRWPIGQVFDGTGAVTIGSGTAYPQWFGAKGDGITGDSAAINKALIAAYTVKLHHGNYLINAPLVTRDFNAIEADTGVGYAPSPSSAVATLTKGFNGDMFAALGKGAIIRGLYLNGKGATYTGRGIVIDGNDFQVLENNVILDTAGHCVEYVSRGANSTIRGGIMTTYDVTTTAAIKFPASELNGDRIMDGISAVGGKLFNFSGCATVLVSNCSFVQSDFAVGSKKVSMTGCRIATSTPFVIEGADHALVGNVVANNMVLGTSLNNTVFAGNTIAETYDYVDNSTLKNSHIDGTYSYSFTPTFAAAGGGALGDGTLTGTVTGSYKKKRLDITFTIGSTTNLGTGAWVFGGFPAGKIGAVGTAYSSRSGNGYVMAATIGTTTDLYLYSGGGFGPVQYNVPIAWASGDIIRISVDY